MIENFSVKNEQFIQNKYICDFEVEFNKKKVIYFNNIQSACKNCDLIIIHTVWNEFKQLNFNKINNKKSLKIFDIRNLYSPVKMKNNKIEYYSIGR